MQKNSTGARVKVFACESLQPAGFFDLEVTSIIPLLDVFSSCIEANGRQLFLDSNALLGDLKTEDFKLICTLAWLADGNNKRVLPEFRLLCDRATVTKFETTFGDDIENGLLAVTSDRYRKLRVDFLAKAHEITNIRSASLSGHTERESAVESVFISYTKNDEEWARWIAKVLIEAGYKVVVQFKDFVPGSNFVQEMDKAIKATDRTIAVLSPDYLKSDFAGAEWKAAFSLDPLGEKRKLIPLRVKRTSVKGLLGPTVYADLFGLTAKSAAAVLLGALSAEGRPSQVEAAYPGTTTADEFSEVLTKHEQIELKKGGDDSIDSEKRLELAQQIMNLSTNQLNVLIFSLAPPENEIPPMSAAARERAQSLLSWCSRQGIQISVLEKLLSSI